MAPLFACLLLLGLGPAQPAGRWAMCNTPLAVAWLLVVFVFGLVFVLPGVRGAVEVESGKLPRKAVIIITPTWIHRRNRKSEPRALCRASCFCFYYYIGHFCFYSLFTALIFRVPSIYNPDTTRWRVKPFHWPAPRRNFVDLPPSYYRST